MSYIVWALIVAAVAVAVLYIIDRKFILDEVTKLRNDAAADVAWLQAHLPGAKVAIQAPPNAIASTATVKPVAPVVVQVPAPAAPVETVTTTVS